MQTALAAASPLLALQSPDRRLRRGSIFAKIKLHGARSLRAAFRLTRQFATS